MSSSAIWSLYSVLIFYAHRFFNISSTLAIMQQVLEGESEDDQSSTLEFQSRIQDELNIVREHCLAIGLTLSVRQIDRIGLILKADHEVQRHANLSTQIEALAVRIQDELQDCLFMRISNGREQFFSDPRGQFGKASLDKFPSVIFDVESASKCYATGNPTAVVFHLMRVLECGLRALGKSLNNPSLDPSNNPTWETILRKCDDELRKPLKDRSDLWRADDKFYSEATANLRAVKDAWRNPTMHIEQIYADDQALTVMNTVKSFMKHLATKLTE